MAILARKNLLSELKLVDKGKYIHICFKCSNNYLVYLVNAFVIAYDYMPFNINIDVNACDSVWQRLSGYFVAAQCISHHESLVSWKEQGT